MKITAAFLTPYIRENKKHKNYKTTVSLYKELKVHADGETPADILMERRPGESKAIYDYRTKNYQCKTKMVVSKIQNCLAKIGRSVDWNVSYDKNQKAIPGVNTLQQYCEDGYPKFGSLTNWLFSITLKQFLIDPNAVVLLRMNEVPAANQLPGPVLEIFNSDRVLDYVEGQYAVLKSADACTYVYEQKTYDDGEMYYIVTKGMITKLSQANPGKTSWTQEDTIITMDEMPCFKLGGLIKESGQEFLYESRINGILPSLNTVVGMISDKHAEIIQHVHSLMWQYQTQVCKKCNGLGTYKPKADAAPIACDAEGCNGGTVPTSPYMNLVMNSNTKGIGQNEVPIPMAGYIQKSDVAQMLKAINDNINQEIYDAYAAVSMEFLMDVPLAQSGIAKAVDKDELNNFVHSVAFDLVEILNRCYSLIAKMRYGYVAKTPDKIKSMCPTVAVPQKFDLLSDTFLVDEIAKLRNAQVDPVIIAALEAEYAAKKLKDNDSQRELIQAVYNLNPFKGVNTTDLMTRLTNGGIEQLDYIICCNIFNFVERASDENADFYAKPRPDQKVILREYAQEKQDEISGEAEIKRQAALALNPPAPAPGKPQPNIP